MEDDGVGPRQIKVLSSHEGDLDSIGHAERGLGEKISFPTLYFGDLMGSFASMGNYTIEGYVFENLGMETSLDEVVPDLLDLL